MAQPAIALSTQFPEFTPQRGAVLVVEDREDVRQGLAQLLELHGFLVADAGDGEGALEHLQTSPGDVALILLDLILPGRLNGCAFRAHQLAAADLARIPTIVITASELDTNERARLHPEAWLDKPFRFDELLQLVKRYVVPEAPAAFLD
jgi:CheY-like chemotaxis protein